MMILNSMMVKKYTFIFILGFFIQKVAFCQEVPSSILGQSLYQLEQLIHIPKVTFKTNRFILFKKDDHESERFLKLLEKKHTPIPRAYCYEDLAFFCKLEVKLEKQLKIPFKIRLGEVNYVEQLEGKPHSKF